MGDLIFRNRNNSRSDAHLNFQVLNQLVLIVLALLVILLVHLGVHLLLLLRPLQELLLLLG